jgi:hypothetical protein
MSVGTSNRVEGNRCRPTRFWRGNPFGLQRRRTFSDQAETRWRFHPVAHSLLEPTRNPHSLFATPLGMSAVCAFGPKTEAEAAAPQAKSNVCDGEWRGRLPTAD